MQSFWRWRDGIESKGLRVNVGKMKVISSSADNASVLKTCVWPSVVCVKGVGVIIPSQVLCNWIQKKCKGMMGSLNNVIYFTSSLYSENQTKMMMMVHTHIGN